MRSDRIATWTSGEPVSPDLVAYVLMTSALRPVVIDIGHNLSSLPALPVRPAKLNTRLGTISPRSISASAMSWPADRDVDRAAEDGSVPSAQQNGLAPVEPCRICPADGQRRDVVQRGLNGQ